MTRTPSPSALAAPAAERRPHVRVGLRRALATLLRVRSRPYPFGEGRSLWILAPHFDDDALGCGGMILLSRLEGARVRVAYLTDGSASHPGHPILHPGALASRRRAEAHAAAAVMGLDPEDLRFFGAVDGTLKDLQPAEQRRLTEALADDLRQFAPEDVLLPCRRDGSSEHEPAFRLACAALARLERAPRVLEYPVWAWWNPIRLRHPVLRSGRVWTVDYRGYEHLKARAIAQHASQVEASPPWPEPVVSPSFAAAFVTGREYFFEQALP